MRDLGMGCSGGVAREGGAAEALVPRRRRNWLFRPRSHRNFPALRITSGLAAVILPIV